MVGCGRVISFGQKELFAHALLSGLKKQYGGGANRRHIERT